MKNRYIILTVGYTHSGKTTFANQLMEKRGDLIRLERDPIAAMLHSDFPVLKEIDLENRRTHSKTIKDKIYELLLQETIDHDLHVVISTCHAARVTRDKVIGYYREHIPQARFIIVYFDIAMSILEDRVKRSNRPKNILALSDNFAVALDRQKTLFDVPTEDECDLFLTVKNNHNNDEVMTEIMSVLDENRVAAQV